MTLDDKIKDCPQQTYIGGIISPPMYLCGLGVLKECEETISGCQCDFYKKLARENHDKTKDV